MIFDEEDQNHSLEEELFLTNGAVTTGYPQGNDVGPLLTPYTRTNSKWTSGLNIRTKIVKLLEEYIGVKLHDLGFVSDS